MIRKKKEKNKRIWNIQSREEETEIYQNQNDTVLCEVNTGVTQTKILRTRNLSLSLNLGLEVCM